MAKAKTADISTKTRFLVLYGPEAVVRREHMDTMRAAFDEEHGGVHIVECEGKTAQLADVLDELRTYSLMMSYKLVIVTEADDFVKQHRASLERYAVDAVDHATLVLHTNVWHKGKLDKVINKIGAIIKCETPTGRTLSSWVSNRSVTTHGRKIQPDAVRLLIDRLGASLGRLDAELGKLSIMVPEGQAIDTEQVAQQVGRSSDEKAWVVQESMLEAITSARGGGDAAGTIIEKTRELIDLAGEADVFVWHCVADLMRKIALGAAMKQQGASDLEIGKALKLWGPRQKLIGQALSRMDAAAADRLFEQALEVERRSRAGLGNTARNLECFATKIADNVA